MQKLIPLFVLTLALAVIICCCVILAVIMGHGPLDLLRTIATGAWGSLDGAAATLGKITPLLLTGLAVALAYQAGLLNIGCEGQLTLGALAAASLAVRAAALPAMVLTPCILLVGALIGGFWALPVVWLRQRRGVHEVISSLLMNYVAIYVADYLVRGPLGDGTALARTPVIPVAAQWQPLWQEAAVDLTLAPLAALLLSLAAQMWLVRTVWGYEVTATGSNALAAELAGIRVSSWQRRIFVASGMLAGLAGALEVVAIHHRFYASFSPGYGFDGITVAFLVKAAPAWLWLSSLIMATLRASEKWLQLLVGISPNAILMIEAVLLLVVACQGFYWDLLLRLAAPSFSTLDRAALLDELE
jgi:general nucleoside transport system permease protein